MSIELDKKKFILISINVKSTSIIDQILINRLSESIFLNVCIIYNL